MALEYMNLKVIGTSHISRQSIKEVKEALDSKPDIVAIELDINRLNALKSASKASIRLKDIFKIGLTGIIFALLGNWAQKKLGNIVGVVPGTEMITAFRLARKSNIETALIDQDLRITLARLSKAVTWKEKLRFPYDVAKTILFRKSEMRRLGIDDFDLSKVPEKRVIQLLINELRKNYPNVYKVLVLERNAFMAGRLSHIMRVNPQKMILAVVGAGHEEEIISLVKRLEKEENITYEFKINKQKTI